MANLQNIKTLTPNLIIAIVLSVSIMLLASTVYAAAPGQTAAGATLEQRVAQRKAEFPAPLDEKVAKRYQTSCSQSQSKIRVIQSDTRSLQSERAKVYSLIDAKLYVTIGKLKLANVDTFKLESAQTKYVAEVDAFNSLMTGYQQTLDDVLVINCAADVAAFNALVQTARSFDKALAEQAKLINGTVIDDIKGTLSAYTTELQ